MSCSRITLCLALLALPREAPADLIHEELGTTASSPTSCSDDNAVVGYRKCRPYGDWSVNVDERALFVSYGTAWRHFGDAKAATTAARSTTPSSASTESVEALMFVERVGIIMTPGVYIAFETEMGNFASGAEAASHDIVVSGAGAFGLRGQLGALTLGAELGVGYRAYSEPDDYDLTGEFVLEARGRVDLWVTPWFTIGGVLGSSLRNRDDWMAGLNISFHTRSYAGER